MEEEKNAVSDVKERLRQLSADVSNHFVITNHFGVKHVVRNPFVIVIGVSKYKLPWPTLDGVTHDITKMRKLWRETLKFETAILTEHNNQRYKNCTDSDINDFLFNCKVMIKNEEENPFDALICIISGHGLENEFIASNGERMNLNKTFFDPFNASKVSELKSYPKIYLLDVCRGNAPSHVIEQRKKVKGIYENRFMSINVESDYRVSYAQTPGKYTPAKDDGGVFIQPFYQTMMYLFENGSLHKTDFQTILRMSSQKAKVNNRNDVCPVHEDYTDYKIFINCNDEKDDEDDGFMELSEYSVTYSDFLERQDTENQLREEIRAKEREKKKKKKKNKRKNRDALHQKDKCNCCGIECVCIIL